jgi:hypothetical protein
MSALTGDERHRFKDSRLINLPIGVFQMNVTGKLLRSPF